MRNQKLIAAGIFLCTFVFHSAVHFEYLARSGDFLKYPEFAKQCVSGSAEPARLIDFSPLYLAVHSLALRTTGRPEAAVRWTQFALTGCAAVTLFFLLRSFFAAAAALAWTAVFVTSRSLVLYSGVLEPEIVLIFIIVVFLLCATGRTMFAAFLSGLFLGLGLLLRQNLLPLVLLVPLHFWLNRRRDGFFLRRVVLFAAPALLALALLAVRNHAATGVFSPVGMNPGDVFFEGNNPIADGQNAVYPPMVMNLALEGGRESDPMHEAYRMLPRRIAGQRLTVPEVNAFWAGKARNYIADHPWRWGALICRKAYLVLHGFRSHDIYQVTAGDERIGRSRFPLPSVPFGLISAMAVVGMLVSLRFWRERFLLYAVLVCQAAVMVSTYASDRLRVSVLALFVFFAAAALEEILDKRYSLLRRLAAACTVLCLFLFLSLQSDYLKDSRYQRNRLQLWHDSLSEAFRDRNSGQFPAAAEKAALAHAAAPMHSEAQMAGLAYQPRGFSARSLSLAESLAVRGGGPSAQLDIAQLLIENDSLIRARKILDRLAGEHHRFSSNAGRSALPEYYLAVIEERQGRRTGAVALLRRALRRNPGDPWVLSLMASLTGDTICEERITRYFDAVDAAYFMGKACLVCGRAGEAARYFSYLTEKVPEYRNGLVYLSMAVGAGGDYRRAAQTYIRAMKMKAEPVFGEREIVAVFRRWVDSEPRCADAKYFLGMVLRDFGRYDEAAAVLGSLVSGYPRINEAAAAAEDQLAWIARARKTYEMPQRQEP